MVKVSYPYPPHLWKKNRFLLEESAAVIIKIMKNLYLVPL
ncbi:hypothetical protein LDG_5950 [Legionella drancourtii LLAP12]|uniref:Uncharacterized protein n=1 Tax=Legionella drancourtii LLAP12 TaxID=658187 RepID=G9ELF2_9GAMM|nr:hypothetical protein LDG_5950 [Legionella drancourtii LLAP12]